MKRKKKLRKSTVEDGSAGISRTGGIFAQLLLWRGSGHKRKTKDEIEVVIQGEEVGSQFPKTKLLMVLKK